MGVYRPKGAQNPNGIQNPMGSFGSVLLLGSQQMLRVSGTFGDCDRESASASGYGTAAAEATGLDPEGSSEEGLHQGENTNSAFSVRSLYYNVW